MHPGEDVLNRLVWKEKRLLLDDLVFCVGATNEDERKPGDPGFDFAKSKRMIDQYASFWQTRPGFSARNILELGIYEGGSIAFWYEFFKPDKIDSLHNSGSFRRNSLQGRWLGTNASHSITPSLSTTSAIVQRV